MTFKLQIYTLMFTIACAVECQSSWSQESAVKAIAPNDSLPKKGPYELTFADFEWQPSSDTYSQRETHGFADRLPTLQAIDMFKKRVDRGSSDYASMAILGELLLRYAGEEDHLPSYAEASDMFAKARRVNPNYKPAIIGAAKVMMAQHQFADALQEILAAVPSESQRPAELALIVDCHLDMGNLELAKTELDKLALLEKSPPVDARIARLAELKGDRETAIRLIRSALQTIQRGSATHDEWHWYQWRLASLLFDSGDLSQAEDLIRKVLDEQPSDERAKVLLAKIEFAKKQPVVAKKLLLEIVSLHPSPPSLALLGDLCHYQNDLTRAKEYWDAAEALIREEAVVAKAAHAREAAIFLADHDRCLTEALDLILLDRKQRQDHQTIDAHAWILYKNNRLKEALNEITELMKRNTSDLLGHYHATKIYHAAGQTERAKQHLQIIINTNPMFSALHSRDIANLQMEWKLVRQDQ